MTKISQPKSKSKPTKESESLKPWTCPNCRALVYVLEAHHAYIYSLYQKQNQREARP
jgi:hypothetical protein